MSALSLARLRHFLERPMAEKRETIRFFARRGLSRIPYVPLRVRLELPGNSRIVLWWSSPESYLPPGSRLLGCSVHDADVGQLRFLFSYLQAGAVFFDIGSHHGLYAVVAAKRLRGLGEIVAFEPSARERRRLKLHLRMNGAERVKVEACAVGSCRSTAALRVPVDRALSIWGSLRPKEGFQGPVAVSTVEVLSLDKYVEQRGLKRLDVMKVDTEGAELEVLRGAERVLAELRPIVLCEVEERSSAPWGYPARQIVAHLHGYDYDWYDVCPDGSLFPHTPREEYPEWRNYLAAPREKRSSVAPWVSPVGEGIPA